jgi:serine/threonine protein kinase
LQEILPLLQFLHDRQVIHRDIKPANLVQRRGDEPLMLVDFGTAKHTTQSALAKPGTVLGSAEYAAPEQLVGKAIAPSDLYSLGVTCIQLLTGLAPFDLYSGNTWIWRSVAPDVSDTLAQVLDKLLQNSASQRYQSAAEVMQALGILPFGRTIVQSSAAPLPLQLWDCTQTDSGCNPAECDRRSSQSSGGRRQRRCHLSMAAPDF